MKTCVYNRFWPSLGGGERYAGMIAATLAADGHDVDLLGVDDVDLDSLARHLSLDLSGVRMRVVTDYDESSIAEVSAEYDLLVNSTYMSRLKPKSARSAYVCFFPTPPDHELSDLRRNLAKRIGPHLPLPAQVGGYDFGTGWYPPEGGIRHQWSWSDGEGLLELPAGSAKTLSLILGRPGSSDVAQTTIVDQDDRTLSVVAVGEPFRATEFEVPGSTKVRTLRVLSATFDPPQDNRHLGIALAKYSLRDRLTATGLVGRRFPWLLTGRAEDRSFLEDYDSIVTISQYTKKWTTRLWGKESDLLFPPIDVDKMDPSEQRDKTIITIGRFFDPVRGHSKRQLEMVEIFRRLVEDGKIPGWTLHMVGGCEESNRPYFEKVMAASEGLPIELHPNAPRHILERLINHASIFWAATGMNEDTERRPWRNEHFGMTTAEAMAAGCVPVVIDRAGQQEIVRDGIDGYRWETMDEAVRRTAEVAQNPALRNRLSAAAIIRAREFSDAAFSARWREICQERDLLVGRASTPGTPQASVHQDVRPRFNGSTG